MLLASRANIVPSNKTMYKLGDLEAAVKSQLGGVPYFGCTQNGTVLSEVWYFNYVFGTVSVFCLALK
jgi:ribonuclease T2